MAKIHNNFSHKLTQLAVIPLFRIKHRALWRCISRPYRVDFQAPDKMTDTRHDTIIRTYRKLFYGNLHLISTYQACDGYCYNQSQSLQHVTTRDYENIQAEAIWINYFCSCCICSNCRMCSCAVTMCTLTGDEMGLVSRESRAKRRGKVDCRFVELLAISNLNKSIYTANLY